MKNKDTIQNFIFESLPVRGEIVHLNATFQEIMEKHQYPPIIRRWLGEALVLVALLSTLVKFSGKIAIQFQGKGKFNLLLVQCTNELELRGLAQWEGEDITEEEILASLQQGNIIITIDQENANQRYHGIVAWQGKTLAESIEGYFKDSEQLLTRIWVEVDEHSASGFLLQRIPEKAVRRESSLDHDWEHINYLTATLTPHELTHLDNKVLLHRLYVEEDVRIFDERHVMFKCACSEKRSANAILTMGRAEAEEELQAKKEIVVKCEFCNHEYIFDRVDVAAIFHSQSDEYTSSGQVH